MGGFRSILSHFLLSLVNTTCICFFSPCYTLISIELFPCGYVFLTDRSVRSHSDSKFPQANGLCARCPGIDGYARSTTLSGYG
jgi:hypothetical protein